MGGIPITGRKELGEPASEFGGEAPPVNLRGEGGEIIPFFFSSLRKEGKNRCVVLFGGFDIERKNKSRGAPKWGERRLKEEDGGVSVCETGVKSVTRDKRKLGSVHTCRNLRY